MGGFATAVPKSDPFASLGAVYEPQAAQGGGAPQDPFGSLGAVYEPEQPAAPKPAPPGPASMATVAGATPGTPTPAQVLKAPVPPALQRQPATISAYEPTWGERAHNFIRNSPLGHAVQTEFGDMIPWLSPTTRQGTDEYEREQEGFRFEPLTEGLTQERAQQAVEAAKKAAAIPTSGLSLLVPTPKVPKGAFRATPAAAPTPTEQRVTGAASALSDFTSAPSLTQMVGIAAGIDLAAPAFAGTIAARLAGKGVSDEVIERATHALIGAGFTAQMAKGSLDQFREYREAKARGDEAAANHILGALAFNGTLTALGGAGTGLAAHGALKAMRANGARPAMLEPATEEPTARAAGEEPAAAAPPAEADPFAALGAKYESAPPEVQNVPRGTSEPAPAQSAEPHPPIGATEQETGRPVLQQSPRPEVNQAAATAEHPAVREQIESTLQNVDGAELAGARAEKDAARRDEKIENEGQSPRTVRDYSGFRIAVDSPEAHDRAVAALRQRFEIPDEQDEFSQGNPETGFHGHTLQVREPGSPVTHEVQILPREVAENADTRHGVYEKAREGDEATMAELRAANQADYARFQERTNTEKGGRGESPEPTGAAAQPQAAVPAQEIAPGVPVERRANAAERKRVAEMSPEEMRQALLTSPKTNLPNRRAFDEAERAGGAGAVGMSDADGLKALNDRFGYEAGDSLLAAKAEALKMAGLDAYHDKGDEFLYRAGSEPELREKLERAREILRQTPIVAEVDGKPRTFKGADFSYGTGTDLAAAEGGLKTHKADREARGERARGELRGIAEVGSGAREERPGAEAAPVAVPAAKPEPVTRPRMEGRDGAATEVHTPSSKFAGRYRLVEADKLLPSHNAQTFERNAEYPEGVQERAYDKSKEAQSRVISQAQNFEPRYVVTDNPDAVNGPPIVTPDGTVLGGNSRAMSIQRLYSGAGDAEGYRTALKDKAANFGLKAEDVDAMQKPVLVREIPQPADREAMRRAGSEMNKSLTGALGVSERAVSAGKNISTETMRKVSDMLNKDDLSVRELLAQKGGDLVRMFVDDGVITERERPQYVDSKTGGLSEEGKTFVERALMGRTLDDPRLMDAAPRNIVQKLERAMGSIATFDARPDEWNIIPAIRQAVAEHAEIAQRGLNVETALGQQSFFGPARNPVVDQLVRALNEKPTEVARNFETYAKDAEQNPPGQTRLLGKADAFDAFNHAFGGKLSEQEYLHGLETSAQTEPAAPRRANETGVESVSRSADQRAGAGREERGPVAPRARAATPVKWEKGEHFVVRDPRTGGYRAGEVTYYNHGINGTKPGGRSRLTDGTRLDEIPHDAMRINTSGVKVKEFTGAPAEKELNARVREKLPEYTAKYLEKYTEDGVPTIATDAAKELFPEFKADPIEADRSTAAGAKAIRDAALNTVLKQPVDPERSNVLVTTASPGSGKTSSQAEAGSMPDHAAKIEVIADDPESFNRVLQQVIDSGRRPVVHWIYVDEPGKTVPRMFYRAIGHGEAPGIGRTVQLKYMAEAYSAIPRVIEQAMDKFGDQIDVHVIDNSGPKGTARFEPDPRPFIAEGKKWNYNDVRREIDEATAQLAKEGLFDSERGAAVLASANRVDPGTKARVERGVSESGGANERGAQESKVPGAVLEERTKQFASNLAEARKRSLRENAGQHKAEVIETDAGKSVQMDADAYALWHRSGLGEKVAWRGMSMPRTVANKVEVMLRSLAGSARAEIGGAEAAAGYDRLVQAIRDGRNEDGSVTLLRSDYRPDTMREEAWHGWQVSNKAAEFDGVRSIARSPEVRAMAENLKEMGYGLKPGIEGRSELALELMAKVMSGDPDLKITPEQRADLVRKYASSIREELGDGALDRLPPADTEAAKIIEEVRGEAERGEAGGRAETRESGAEAGGPGEAESGVEGRALRGGAGERSTPAGDERGAGQPGETEGELAAYQRARKAAPVESFSLPGMEAADTERATARAEEQGRELTEEIRRPLGSIERAAGEMERMSPLFSGTDANPQASLFQRGSTEENPVARSVQDLVDALAAEPRNEKQTALEKVADWTGRTIEDSTGRAAKYARSVPGRIERAWANAKLVTAALVDGYRNPLKATDWKRSVGQMDLAKVETALKLQKLAKQMKEIAPDRLSRIGMTHWIEAGGDAKKLDQWRVLAKERWDTARGDKNMDSRLKDHYYDAVEHYEAATKLTPEQVRVAQRVKEHFDDMLALAKANGLLEYGARNYVRHLYESADAADLIRMLDTNELNPDPAFIEKRVFRTYWDAENAGLIPRNKDLGYLVGAYDKSFNQALASRSFLRNLLDSKAADGRPLAAIKLRGKWLTVDKEQQPLVLQQRARPESLAGYREYDLAPTRNFLFEPTKENLEGFEYDPKLFEDDPQRLAFKGDLIFHPEIAERVEDMLTPGWFDRNETAPQKIGHTIMQGSAIAKEIMTMAAPFHMVQLAEHSIEHWVNPLRLPELDLSGKGEASRRQRLLASNGLNLVDYDTEGLFGAKALKGLGEGIPGVNTALDAVNALTRWQFENVIPRMKMKMALKAFDRNWEKYGARMEKEQLARLGKGGNSGLSAEDLKSMAHTTAERMIAELTSKQANAAFGNLNTAFDNVHRSKTFKQLLRLSLFAPDFLESRIRYTGQALTRYGGEQRAAFLRGALGMYVIARIANYWLNNGDAKMDPEHAFTVVSGGRNFSLRSQEGDILHLITDPRGFIYNRLNPLTTTPTVEFLSGRDQFGRQKSFAHQAKDYAKRALPFGVQKVIQTGDEGWLDSVLSSFGLIASNYRSPAEEMTHKLFLQSIPDLPDDPERQAISRENAQLEHKLREGKIKPNDVFTLAREGKMPWAQASNIVRRAQHSKLYNEFSSGGVRMVPAHRGDPSALDIFEKASPLERMELRQAFANKGMHQLPEVPAADRAELVQRWKKLLNSVPSDQGLPSIGEETPDGSVAKK